MATKFYKCRHCGNVIEKVVDSKVPVVCCGEKMEELIPNTVDASGEKHVPVVTRVDENRIKVEVGSVAHPMVPEHYIEWVTIQTKQGNQIKQLTPGSAPKVCFSLCEGDSVEAVYAYCNLHGLWVAK
jgi:superoxide reductase